MTHAKPRRRPRQPKQQTCLHLTVEAHNVLLEYCAEQSWEISQSQAVTQLIIRHLKPLLKAKRKEPEA